MLVYRVKGTLDDEALTGALWDAGASGLEERAGSVHAYFGERLPLEGDELLSGGEWSEEPDRDWQAEWKRGLRPVVAGRVTVVPSWLLGEVEAGQVPLVIEPGMAFGTGHHTTTRLAIEALSARDLGGLRVLDVGTGSGVLALAAGLLGAGFALGLDIDPLTIPVAFENAGLNGFARDGDTLKGPGGVRLHFEQGTLGLGREGMGGEELGGETGAEPYDLLVANLFAELHDTLAADYVDALRPGGPVLLTGILSEKLPLVRAALTREGFTGIVERQDGEWALVTAAAPRG